MEKKELIVNVRWTGDNFGCEWHDDEAGSVVVTGKTLEMAKHNFEESLQLHIQVCLDDGDELPEYLASGNFVLRYDLDTAALLHDAEQYTSLEAISKVSGINARQLSHYANGLKHPRPAQRNRIVAGLHEIGRRLIALS